MDEQGIKKASKSSFWNKIFSHNQHHFERISSSGLSDSIQMNELHNKEEQYQGLLSEVDENDLIEMNNLTSNASS